MSQENRAVVMPLLPGSRSWRSLEKDNLQQLVPVVHANRWRQQGWRQVMPRRRPPQAGIDCSVNSARVQPHCSGVGISLSTSAQAIEAGAFQGGGSGNKAIYGACGLHLLPLAELQHLLIVWQNQAGPAGPHVEPAQAVTVATPYLNLLVDLNAAGDPAGEDILVLVCCSDQLSPAHGPLAGRHRRCADRGIRRQQCPRRHQPGAEQWQQLAGERVFPDGSAGCLAAGPPGGCGQR